MLRKFSLTTLVVLRDWEVQFKVYCFFPNCDLLRLKGVKKLFLSTMNSLIKANELTDKLFGVLKTT